MKFRDFIFGDLSGVREYKRDPEGFISSFVSPEAFSLKSLKNDMNYIIVGRKGTRKSSCCLALANELQTSGYTSDFFNFSSDLSLNDVRDAVRTHTLDTKSLIEAALAARIQELYDFRGFWKRRVLFSIAERLSVRNSNFVKFMFSAKLEDHAVSGGVGKDLKLGPLTLPSEILAKFKISDPIFTLDEYVKMGFQLLRECHPDHKQYFFFDELNLSHETSKSDEFDLKLAMVRDIVRSSSDLNDLFVDNGMNIHVICCLRPEIREELKRRDNEIGKVVDSSFVSLSWPTSANWDNSLIRLLKEKIRHARPVEVGEARPDPSSIIPKKVFNFDEKKDIEFPPYFLNLTWYRPRDIVRLLKSYQATNGSMSQLFSNDGNQIEFLKDYGRSSSSDCLAEMEVKYSRGILDEALRRLQRPVYANIEDLMGELSILERRLDLQVFIDDLFQAGFIFNHQKDGVVTEIFASYRGDTTLHPNKRIIVHRGLQSDPKLGFSRREWAN
ncbi:P-loop ATPase, Sll1717 family [Histidinibacterium lentulum]|uniref:P-loop ATPase, Sll1717 family n=1 Tax=Histidinibacterium lentulum TaxID=2480588 RepID=UPI000F4B2D7C|nr:hypothetical protein [Histidinibacterium lentulum]